MISVVILTKNSEENIEACLDSVSWCDEKIVIDDLSGDETVELAKKRGAKVFKRALNDDFAAQRNFGLEKAEGDWVFFVDSDETVSSSLQFEIVSHINNPLNEISGYYCQRHDFLWGGILKFGDLKSHKFLRLAKKGDGIWVGKVHEIWKIKGKKEKLKNPLLHYPHQNIRGFLKKINYYTDLRALDLFQKKKKTNALEILLYPPAKFFSNFFIWQGWRDGMRGFIHAILMSFHSFLVRGKLWLLWQKTK